MYGKIVSARQRQSTPVPSFRGAAWLFIMGGLLIKVKSPQAKRILAAHLAESDPETLDFLKTFADGFGALQEIHYTGPAEKAAYKELKEKKDQNAKAALAHAREALK